MKQEYGLELDGVTAILVCSDGMNSQIRVIIVAEADGAGLWTHTAL
jgi:hypothetical protein